MRKFKMGIRRFGASFAALLMICCMSAPALAAGNNWPASPSSDDFNSHPYSWYVWQKKTIEGHYGYELICRPMEEFDSTNTSFYPIFSYSTSSSTYSYTSGSGVTHEMMFALPFIPFSSSCGYWADFPSFPVGFPSARTGVVRVYPFTRIDYLAGISDVFNDRSVYGFLTSWRSDLSGSASDVYSHEDFTERGIYAPSNIFFFGERTYTSNNVSGFGIVNGDNNFWATPSNDSYLKLSRSHYGRFHSFPSNFSIPSSDVGFVFCKQPSGNEMHPYNTQFNLTITFVSTLWVPKFLLPKDVQVGDWISKADVESLQDQLVKDFDVNSDTLKNSKDNFDSWQNSNTIDTDVADTSLDIINGLMQNVGQFAFIVSLLCFGAVVLRVLIRKAVAG